MDTVPSCCCERSTRTPRTSKTSAKGLFFLSLSATCQQFTKHEGHHCLHMAAVRVRREHGEIIKEVGYDKQQLLAFEELQGLATSKEGMHSSQGAKGHAMQLGKTNVVRKWIHHAYHGILFVVCSHGELLRGWSAPTWVEPRFKQFGVAVGGGGGGVENNNNPGTQVQNPGLTQEGTRVRTQVQPRFEPSSTQGLTRFEPGLRPGFKPGFKPGFEPGFEPGFKPGF